MVITNCVITNSNAEVLKECVLNDSDPLYKTYGGYHTGIDLAATQVYALYGGTIVSIGKQKEGHSVIIQTGSSLCICYRWIKSLSNIYAGQDISEKTYLGDVYKYVHVESYLKDMSKWPVRIGNTDWYKSDIMNILNNGYISTVSNQDVRFYNELGIKELSDYCGGERNLITDETLAYHTGNKGDD